MDQWQWATFSGYLAMDHERRYASYFFKNYYPCSHPSLENYFQYAQSIQTYFQYTQVYLELFSICPVYLDLFSICPVYLDLFPICPHLLTPISNIPACHSLAVIVTSAISLFRLPSMITSPAVTLNYSSNQAYLIIFNDISTKNTSKSTKHSLQVINKTKPTTEQSKCHWVFKSLNTNWHVLTDSHRICTQTTFLIIMPLKTFVHKYTDKNKHIIFVLIK